MTIGERLVLLMSRNPVRGDYPEADDESRPEDPLGLLERVYPDLSEMVAGKRVIDFGCGAGHQAIALAAELDCEVVGIESNERRLALAEENAASRGIDRERLRFVGSVSDEMLRGFDVVISLNSFEHFRHPRATLQEMSSLLGEAGILLISFGPPWYAPYGSHMHFFCRFPWVHVLFSERAVMQARSHFRDDGALRYEEVECGLNRMSLTSFERLVSSCGLAIDFTKYECIKGFNALAHMPFVREFAVNHVSVVLRKSDKSQR